MRLRSAVRGAFAFENVVENLVWILLFAVFNIVWPIVARLVADVSLAYLVPIAVAVFLTLAALVLFFHQRQQGNGTPASVSAEVPSALYELQVFSADAYQAAKALLEQARHALSESSDLARRDLASSVQRVLDDGAQAYSRATSAIVGNDGTDPDTKMGDFHRGYQGMTTWIGKSFDHSALSSDTFCYRQWREADYRFLSRLREVIARPERRVLYDSVRAAGWNEGVRARLPEPGTPDPAGGIGEHDLVLDTVESDFFASPDDETQLVRLRMSLVFRNSGSENLRWKIAGLSLSVGEPSYATPGGEPKWTGVIASGSLGRSTCLI